MIQSSELSGKNESVIDIDAAVLNSDPVMGPVYLALKNANSNSLEYNEAFISFYNHWKNYFYKMALSFMRGQRFDESEIHNEVDGWVDVMMVKSASFVRDWNPNLSAMDTRIVGGAKQAMWKELSFVGKDLTGGRWHRAEKSVWNAIYKISEKEGIHYTDVTNEQIYDYLLSVENDRSLDVIARVRYGHTVDYLDRPVAHGDDDEYTLADDIAAEPGFVVNPLDDSGFYIKELMSNLPENLLRVVYLYHFADMTQQEIASETGLSQVQVSRSLKKAYKIMKDIETMDERLLEMDKERDKIVNELDLNFVSYLDSNVRRVAELRFVQRQSAADTAKILGISESTVIRFENTAIKELQNFATKDKA